MARLSLDVRSERYEAEFMRNVVREAARRFGVNVDGFELCVARRLRMGSERYGTQYLDRELMSELLEEAWDMAAYAVLEAQKRLASGFEDDGREFHLFEAAVHAAVADWHARQARQ